MSATTTAELLRPGLLEGVSIMLACAAGSTTLRDALADSAQATSARLTECGLPVEEEPFALRLREQGPPDLLVVDSAGVFAAAGGPARTALGRTMQLTWEVTRLVTGALIEQQRPGRIVFVAPAEGGGRGDPHTGADVSGADTSAADTSAADTRTHVRATRAGLENLARTTSIEWARYGITIVTILPGAEAPPESLAALCAYLASPAGSYFSGCVLALDR